ncbi:MAG TPA: mechanosensitive ion channel domain-containing protein [Balneolales bacterium]|nr:mechanosensitive ion channel domain-containing protein [Balneolales bacterium]
MKGSKIFISNVTLENFLAFLFIFIITIIVGNTLQLLVRKSLDERVSVKNAKFAGRIVQYGIFIAGLSYGIYHVLHLDLNALAASLGIISIALAFSSQQIVQNIMSGVIISIKRPIWYDDWIEVGGSGVSRVKDIALTQTTLRGIDGRLFLIPNSMMVSSSVTNYSKAGFITISIPLSFPSDTDLQQVRKIILDIIDGHPKILPNLPPEEKKNASNILGLNSFRRLFRDDVTLRSFEPEIRITDINGSKISLAVSAWIRNVNERSSVISELLQSFFEGFNAKGIRTV